MCKNSCGLQRNDHLKAVRLALEYRQLMKTAPAGVYLLPELDNLHTLHGVIFVRRGLYREGVFRFRIDLPLSYPEKNSHPLIFFTPPVFNPLIDAATGRCDLSQEENMKDWQPEKHFLSSAIFFVKKIFFLKTFDNFLNPANPSARDM